MTTTMLRRQRATVTSRAELTSLLSPPSTSGPWHCPRTTTHPAHHRTPTVAVFVDHSGAQRWHCRTCGDGGTALDLLTNAGMNMGDAIAHLAATPTAPTRPRRNLPAYVTDHLERCSALLWTEQGTPAQDWLRQRGLLDEDCLHINGVGFDPGPEHLRLACGLPRVGITITVPLSNGLNDETTNAVVSFASTPIDGPKPEQWTFPALNLATPPAVTHFTPTKAGRNEVIITNRIIDALSAAILGHHGVAVLGGAYVDPVTMGRLGSMLRSNGQSAVLCFEHTPVGQLAATTVHRLLDESCPVSVLELPADVASLNDWVRSR